MKMLNDKYIQTLLMTLLTVGCTPDSLTKFKKEEPKKAAPAAATTSPTTIGGIPVSSIIDPTPSSITYKLISNNESRTDLIFKINTPATYFIYGNNAFSQESTRELLFKSCSITPSVLPVGLSFNSINCMISGTPTEVFTDPVTFNTTGKGKKTYSVSMTYTNSSNSTTTTVLPITLQVLQAPTSLLYSQSSRVILKVGNTNINSFSALSGNLITDDGKSPANSTKNTIKGTVETIDSTNGYLGVYNLSNMNYLGLTTMFADTNNNYQPDIEPYSSKYYFTINSLVDSDTVYYSEKGQITEIRNVFPSYSIAPVVPPSLQPLETPNTGINPNDLTSRRNYIEYKISPNLPAGLALNPLTGMITSPYTGSDISPILAPIPIPASANGTYRITASNELGSTYYDLKLEIIDTPTRASLTRRQLITLNALTMSYIREGDSIVSPILGINPSIHGLVTKKLTATNQIEVITLDGQFKKNDQIDIGKTFNAMVGTILADPINFNAAITTAANVTVPVGGVAVGDMWVENNTTVAITSNRVYVSATDDTTITSGTAFLTSTILEIDAEAIGLTLTSDPAGNKTGFDILSADADASGYVYEDAGINISVSNILRSINLRDSTSRIYRQGDNVAFDERVAGAASTGTISATTGSIQFKNYITFERASYSYYKVNTVTGSGITYSIAPALPNGITLDPKTGILSGTPTERGAKSNYVITAKNLMGTTSVNVEIEVRDYFTLSNASTAPSFKLHRYGDYQNTRSCRVNASDIFNQTGNLDIRCHLEAEEQDLNTIALKLKAKVGPGLCQHVSITPYHFWRWSPKKTNATVVRWVNSGVVTPSDRAITSDIDCDGNYTLEGGPNCDEGSIKVYNYSYDPTRTAPATAEAFENEETILCGGRATNCLDGSLRSLLEENSVDAGNRGEITPSETGFDKTWTFATPNAKSHNTNLYVSNNLNASAASGNQCTASSTDVNSNINAYYSTYGLLSLIANTSTHYAIGTDTNYYGTSKFTINGIRRGTFTTANNVRSVKPYKTIEVYGKLGPFDGALPYYYISCLDAARESRATIALIVREWNKSFRIQDEIDQDYPDVSLAALGLPVLMRPAGGTVLSPDNDFMDWSNNITTFETISPWNKANNTPNYGVCADIPTYTPPASTAQLLANPFPASTEFQFPEIGL